MPSRKRRRRHPQSLKRRPRDPVEPTQEQDLVEELSLDAIYGAFDLCNVQQLSWRFYSPPESSSVSIDLPLSPVRSHVTAAAVEENGWRFFSDLRFVGNLTGLTEMLAHSGTYLILVQYDRVNDDIQLVVKSRLNINGKEYKVLLCTDITLDVNVRSPEAQELNRLSKAGLAVLLCPLSAETTELAVSVMFHCRLLSGGDPDELPLKSDMIKYSLLHSLQPVTFASFSNESVIDYSDVDQSLGEDLDCIVSGYSAQILQFYKFVRTHQLRLLAPDLSALPSVIPYLTAQLLNFQKKALQWMLYKEQADIHVHGNMDEVEEIQGENALHFLWREIPIEGYSSLYYNPFTGRLSAVRFPPPSLPKGGILADEMGLGKTVEILALILTHRLGNHQDHIGDYIRNKVKENSSVLSNQCTDIEGKGIGMTDGAPEEVNSPRDDRIALELNGEVIGVTNGGAREMKDKSTDRVAEAMIINSEEMSSGTTEEMSSGVTIETSSGVTQEMSSGVTCTMEISSGASEQMTNGGIEQMSSGVTEQMSSEGPQGLNEEAKIHCLCYIPPKCFDKLVQCDVCMAWHHTFCAQFDEEKCKDFICINCLLEKPMPCGATLIIVPETLHHQWLEEIAKHTVIESLSIMVYNGVAKQYINPLHLSNQDIVLVTYETIRRELDRVHHHELLRRLRHRKSYNYPPSPLLAINWWRICLDEAQLVETSHSKAAEMTHKLSAVNRWCITGTPVQRDLRDLYGLVYFLQHRPYCVHQWWKKFIWAPYYRGNPRPIVALFSQVMWRNSKEDVADELCWPKMEEKIHCLSFSPVEDYYYRREEDNCSKRFASVARLIGEKTTSLANVDRSLITRLLNPLHTLRWACCHPQLVKRGYVNFSSANKSYLTMTDLLKKMIVQAKQEGRESLRQLIAAINGLAGIQILQKKYKSAVDSYREAMQTWKSYEEDYVCDRLQRIHTMENLSRLIKEGHSLHSRAVIDDKLDALASDLRSEYIKKQHGQLITSVHSLSSAVSKVRTVHTKANICHHLYLGDEVDETYAAMEEEKNQEMEPQDKEMGQQEEEVEQEDDNEEVEKGSDNEGVTIHCLTKPIFLIESSEPPETPWWSSVIEWAHSTDCATDLYSALECEMTSSHDYIHNLSFLRFRSLSGFQYSVVTHIDKVENERRKILRSLEDLVQSPSESVILAATHCHLRARTNAPLCTFCQVESTLKNYEGLLFSRYQIRAEESSTSRSMSIYERLLKCMLSFLTTKGGPLQLANSGKRYLTYLELLRTEFKRMTLVWMAAEQQVRAYDELRMAANRFQLVSSVDTQTVNEQISDAFLLSQTELSSKLLQFKCDADCARSSLNKNMGQLKYLRNLSDEEAATCPICVVSLKQNQEWAVLPCGHSFCLECLYTLLKHHTPPSHLSIFQQIEQALTRTVTFSCPMCRQRLVSETVNFVRASPVQGEILPSLKGSYSTKVTAVTGTLLKLQQEEPATKTLVFSSSNEVLKLISHALSENSIEHAFLITKNDYQINLKEFKTSSTLNVLLMPVVSGSKGLNIIEATHVFLVEPFLNIGSELQAIGRIYRMGQTKPITVHRFYVKNSVEQRIREMMTNTGDVAKFLNVRDEYSFTVDELHNLFIRNNSETDTM